MKKGGKTGIHSRHICTQTRTQTHTHHRREGTEEGVCTQSADDPYIHLVHAYTTPDPQATCEISSVTV